MAASMYMADGTPIKNPAAYVAKIAQNGYTKKLFTAAGQEIRNPVAFLQKNMGGVGGNNDKNRKMQGKTTGVKQNNLKQKAGAGNGVQSKKMYKPDGSVIQNVQAVLAAIERNGYTQPLYTAKGTLIQNPVAFVGNNSNGASAAIVGSNGRSSSKQMFKEDGTPIYDTAKVLAAIERKGYTQALYTAAGTLINNPVAFVGSGGENGGKPDSSSKSMYKADGSLIVNPAQVLKAIAAKGYTQILYTAAGTPIHNPLAFAKQSGMRHQGSVALGKMGRALAGKKKLATSAVGKKTTGRSQAQKFKPGGSLIVKPNKVLKADGQKIKNSVNVAKRQPGKGLAPSKKSQMKPQAKSRR